jgi:hypothetical protein
LADFDQADSLGKREQCKSPLGNASFVAEELCDETL